jgi:hypothetical protein
MVYVGVSVAENQEVLAESLEREGDTGRHFQLAGHCTSLLGSARRYLSIYRRHFT